MSPTSFRSLTKTFFLALVILDTQVEIGDIDRRHKVVTALAAVQLLDQPSLSVSTYYFSQ